jgi:hypothetical protein
MMCDSCFESDAVKYDKDMMMHVCYECSLDDITITVDVDEDMFA